MPTTIDEIKIKDPLSGDLQTKEIGAKASNVLLQDGTSVQDFLDEGHPVIDNKQDKILSSSLVIDGVTTTTVEDSLDTLNEKKQNAKLASNITVDGVVTTAIEDTVNQLNNKKQNKALASTMVIDGFTASTVEDSLDKLNQKKLNVSLKGQPNGLAELDKDGIVPLSQLPGTLSELEKYDTKANFPAVGRDQVLYVALDTNYTYRWTGVDYVQIDESVQLGITHETAYYGDLGKIAYDHSQTQHARVDATKVEASNTNGNIKINGAETTVYTPPGVVSTAANGLAPKVTDKTKFLKGDGTWATPDNTTYSVATLYAAGLMSTADREKINSIATSAEVNVQSDWNVTDASSDAFIKNKPTIPVVTGKADKVSGATADNFAGLDSNGNLKDSGKKATDFAAASHNQASSTITTMSGYSKASSAAAISTSDSLNTAVGKLEKSLDGKAASSHNQASNTITTMTGYAKASSAAAISTSDSLNTAIGKLEKTLDGKTSNTGTVTKIATGTGLTGGPVTTSGTISLASGVVTAGSAGPTAAVTGNDGTTIAVPRITVDTYGRVTGLTSYNLTNKNTWRGIQDNLTSDSASDSLSAKQGKALNTKKVEKISSGWTYNIKIVSGTGSGQIIWIITTYGYITLQTSGSSIYIQQSSVSNNSQWTYSNSGLTITLNCTAHLPVQVLASDNNVTVTFTDTSTPQSKSLPNTTWVPRTEYPFKLGIDNGSYGYYTTANSFVAFRKPTGTATTAQVLSGYTFSNASSDGLSGGMANRGALTNAAVASGTFPAGYYSSNSVTKKAATTVYTSTANQSIAASQFLTGAQTILGVSMSNISAANIKNGVVVKVGDSASTGRLANVTGTFTSCAAASAITTADVLKGKIGWVNGAQINGNMTNQGAWTSTGVVCNATTTKNVIIPAGYHNGSGYVQLKSLKDQTGPKSGTTAVASAQMMSGYSGWVNGVQVTGSIANKGAQTATLTNASTVYTIPAGYHNGSGKVYRQASTALRTITAAEATNVNSTVDIGAQNNYRYVNFANVKSAVKPTITTLWVNSNRNTKGQGFTTTTDVVSILASTSTYYDMIGVSYVNSMSTASAWDGNRHIQTYYFSTYRLHSNITKNVILSPLEQTVSSLFSTSLFGAIYYQWIGNNSMSGPGSTASENSYMMTDYLSAYDSSGNLHRRKIYVDSWLDTGDKYSVHVSFGRNMNAEGTSTSGNQVFNVPLAIYGIKF